MKPEREAGAREQLLDRVAEYFRGLPEPTPSEIADFVELENRLAYRAGAEAGQREMRDALILAGILSPDPPKEQPE